MPRSVVSTRRFDKSFGCVKAHAALRDLAHGTGGGGPVQRAEIIFLRAGLTLAAGPGELALELPMRLRRWERR